MTISLSFTSAIYKRFLTTAISFSSMFSLIPLGQIIPIGQMSWAFQRVLTQTVNLSIGFDSPLRLLCVSLKTEGASVLLSQLPRSSSRAQGFLSSIRPFRSRSMGRWDSDRAAGLGPLRPAKQSSSPANVPDQAGTISIGVLRTKQQYLLSNAKATMASLPSLTRH